MKLQLPLSFTVRSRCLPRNMVITIVESIYSLYRSVLYLCRTVTVWWLQIAYSVIQGVRVLRFSHKYLRILATKSEKHWNNVFYEAIFKSRVPLKCPFKAKNPFRTRSKYYPVYHKKKLLNQVNSPVPEIIDPVFAKTSQNARFLLSENERFGLVFVKLGL
jgi:hypothetical protein